MVNNVSSQAQLLGIEKLKQETSTNFTLGLGGKVNRNLSFTVDYYSINVKDRIVLGTEITGTAFNDKKVNIGTTPLDDILRENNLSDLSFFSNALDTKTSGIDVVIGYNKIEVGEGMLGFNLSGNYVIENARDGAVKNPEIVAAAGQSVVNATQEALFFTSRPEMKWILGTTYDIGKFGFNLNNTFFGKTTFKQQGMSSDLRTEFTPKVVTDFGINFNATEKLTFSLNVNNLLNVLPEWAFKAENATGQALIDNTTFNSYGITPIQEQSNLITFNQRYSQMTYDGYHFSQLGTLFNLSLNYQF